MEPVDIVSQWCDDWSSTSAVNCAVSVQDRTIRPPGFSCQGNSETLNRFKTNQGHCGACRKLWGLVDSNLCVCGASQTMFHIVESCPLTKLDGRLNKLHMSDDSFMNWLSSCRTQSATTWTETGIVRIGIELSTGSVFDAFELVNINLHRFS